MTRVRRLVAAAAIAGTLLIPFAISAAPPASAYCEARLIDDGGSGCSNSCPDENTTMKKVSDRVGVNLEWNCLQ